MQIEPKEHVFETRDSGKYPTGLYKFICTWTILNLLFLAISFKILDFLLF